MKKTLLILTAILAFNSVNAQWYYKTKKSDFSNDYKIAYTLGTGNNYPYNDVSLFIRNTSGSDGIAESVDVFIAGFGYFSSYSSDEHEVKISIDSGEVYTSLDLSVSTDNDTLFLGDFVNESGDTFSIEFILKLMKEGSKMSIRTFNGSSFNTAKFSLSGSTKAINFTYPDLESNITSFNSGVMEVLNSISPKITYAILITHYLTIKERRELAQMIGNNKISHVELSSGSKYSFKPYNYYIDIVLNNGETVPVSETPKMSEKSKAYKALSKGEKYIIELN